MLDVGAVVDHDGVMESEEHQGLADLLRGIRMDGIFYCPSFLTEPWGVSLPPMPDCIWFHVVTSGGGTLVAGDDEPIEFRAGDLVLVPHGTGHRAWGTEPAATPNVLDLPHDTLTEQYGVLRHGGGGEPTDLVCGGVRFDHPAARTLLDALPPVIHLRGDRVPRRDWLHQTLELIEDETRAARPGSDAIVSRLCDIIVMQAIRTWLDTDPQARTGWLGALRDPRIGRAMSRIHLDPAGDWTVATLADEAAMSRSAFSARFTDLVGEPAMRYVTRWRMQVAHDLLERGEHTVAAAGRAVGYLGEAAFSRAFKREHGVSPGAIARRTHELITPVSAHLPA